MKSTHFSVCNNLIICWEGFLTRFIFIRLCTSVLGVNMAFQRLFIAECLFTMLTPLFKHEHLMCVLRSLFLVNGFWQLSQKNLWVPFRTWPHLMLPWHSSWTLPGLVCTVADVAGVAVAAVAVGVIMGVLM